jgi:hypothetical protein
MARLRVLYRPLWLKWGRNSRLCCGAT